MQTNMSTEMAKTHCPYCGARITLVIDPIDDEQNYTEDCEACCQPMVVAVSSDGQVEVSRESD